MASDLEELGIKIGFELEKEKLKQELAEVDKIVGQEMLETFDKVSKKGSKKASKNLNDEIKKNTPLLRQVFSKSFNSSIVPTIKGALLNAFSVGLGFLGAQAALAATRIISKVFQGSFQRAIQFEKGVAEVNTILDKNAKLTDSATNAILRFSTQFGTEQQKQVRAFYNIVSAGVKGTNDQLSVLEIANKAAVAGLVNIDTAAFALVSSVNAYSRSGLTAARASDILFKGVKEGQLVFRDLANAIGRVAPIGEKLGLSFSQVIGSLAGITRTGLKADEAASALRQLFSTLSGPSEQAKKLIADVNAEIQKSIDKQVELGQITAEQGLERSSREIINFSKAGIKAAGGLAPFLANLTKQVRGNNEAFNTLFKNIRAFNAVASATANVKQFQQILDSVEDSAGATNAAFNILSQTLDFKIQRSVAILRSFGTILLESLIPPAKSALDFFINNFGPGIVKTFEIVLMFLPTLELGMNLIVAVFKDAAARVRVAWAGTGAAVTGVISSIIDGIGFLSPSLRASLSGVQAILDDANKDFSSSFVDALVDVEQSFSGVLQFGFSNAVDGIKDKLNDVLVNTDTFVEKFKKLMEKFTKASKDAAKQIENDQKRMDAAWASAIGGAIVQGVEVMGKALANGENIVNAFADNFLNIVGGMAKQIGQVMIMIGVGQLEVLKGNPLGTIAIGAGLVLLGTLLQEFGGGGDTAPSAAGGAGGGGVASGGLLVPEEAEPEEIAPQTVVNLNVEGSIFDGDQTARRLADLLNAGFENENITLKQGF